ncbi:MAG: hypothetical protein L0312_29480, partial [Acidobacteria bacterium]|nr:hypothetical protein [Acidobacteriota bacterium]
IRFAFVMLLQLQMKAVRDGAELRLTVTNRSIGPWGSLAGIIPSFNPAMKESSPEVPFLQRPSSMSRSIRARA